MRRRFVMGVLWLSLASPVLAEPSEPPTQLSPQEIRIPSITKKWKRPEGSNGPDITIDDIERCMGQNADMRQAVQGIKHEQSQLEGEQAQLAAKHEELAQGAHTLDTRRQVHQARVDQFHADSASLASRLSGIEKRKRDPAKTRQDMVQTNQLVAAYNADVAKLNSLRSALLQEEGAINQAVAAYNEDAAHTNQRVASFNERNGGFQRRAAELANTSAAYNASCGGERVLRK